MTSSSLKAAEVSGNNILRPLTIPDLKKKAASGEKIAMLTAYDCPFAGFVDEAGADIVLVGDSLGMVVLGYDSTVPVTMDEMLHHAKAVRRGVKRALLVADMPFLSYQISEEEAIKNAGRFLKEAGCHGVKIEGGLDMAGVIRRVVKAGIPVMGHIGLTPQTVTALGGYKVQGKDVESAKRLIEDALAVEEAGAFAIVLECIPTGLAGLITEKLSIPTIGIGAGPLCSGQVLVINDILGLFDRFIPRFVKQYANLAPQIRQALKNYVEEVREGRFPLEENSF
ncbi:MAG: 3-methyl-2-oxobutanoate hydroxymethyltransferase [Dissulfurimicrobium sp.]|uniref:3-methyl-2-oxobutanoate hydroxymethyltransferase n=1 Tax=Dissulfurimicrobium TaxID=1769732 RepID=UPI001EDA22E8|nr:3-methyl-2-oxobutanoate hydroxymethyltransferase [Dissulfurimicrobium hydrothermale]UKL13160.1 3-methyl-2-oxobutanoate hydroxymethyltransferase [Dissulfurimicrobium hydrothermale]